MYNIKKRVYEVIEVSSIGDRSSRAYDVLLTVTIIVGLIPMTLKGENTYTRWIEVITSAIFLCDYIARVWTADYKMGYKNYRAYIAYVLTPLAIFDLLSILPVLVLFSGVSNNIRFLRFFRLMYSNSVLTFGAVIRAVILIVRANTSAILRYPV